MTRAVGTMRLLSSVSTTFLMLFLLLLAISTRTVLPAGWLLAYWALKDPAMEDIMEKGLFSATSCCEGVTMVVSFVRGLYVHMSLPLYHALAPSVITAYLPWL